MKSNNRNKSIHLIILTGYLIVLFTGAFHVHKLNLVFNYSSKIFSEQIEDKYIHNLSKCTISANSQSIQTVTILSNSLQFNNPSEQKFKLLETYFIDIHLSQSNISHRAPPFV